MPNPKSGRSGSRRWSATPLVGQMRNYIANPADSIGALDPSALAHALNTDATVVHSHLVPTLPDNAARSRACTAATR